MAEAFTEERAKRLWNRYLWMERHTPQRDVGLSPSIVLPTADFFPDKFSPNFESAKIVLRRVQRQMELQSWCCHLIDTSSPEKELRDKLLNSGVSGEYAHGLGGRSGAEPIENEVTIDLDPTLLKDPIGLVASFAQHLSRHLIGNEEVPPPEGWTVSSFAELADLVAVNEGFGVFLCNSAFTFDQWTGVHYQGWQYTTRGFLSDSELAFCLAIFCIRRCLDPQVAVKQLKPNPREIFLDALDFVADLNSPPPSE